MGLQSKESDNHSDLDFEENFQQKKEKIEALIQELKEKKRVKSILTPFLQQINEEQIPLTHVIHFFTQEEHKKNQAVKSKEIL